MNNILVPYDFDPQTDQAFTQAIHLARHTHSSIVLLYVHEPHGFLSSLFSQEQKDEFLERISDQIDAVAATMSIKSGIDINVRVEVGRIYSVIADVAEKLGAEFIVMGARGMEASSPEKVELVGANTSRVIRLARCPVITIGGKDHFDGCRSILLPVDYHLQSQQKIDLAVNMARNYGAKVNIVAVVGKGYKKRLVEKTKAQIERVQSQIAGAGIEYSVEVIEIEGGEKEAVVSFLNYAESKGDVDLIIIMTQQGASIMEFFVDSMAQEFIRRSKIPVMSVTPTEVSVKNKG